MIYFALLLSLEDNLVYEGKVYFVGNLAKPDCILLDGVYNQIKSMDRHKFTIQKIHGVDYFTQVNN